MVSRIAVALAFALQVGCSEADAKDDGASKDAPILVPGCEAESTLACDVTLEECQTAIYGLMRCLRGMDPDKGKPPPVDFVTSDEFANTYEDDEMSMDPPASDVALQLLGLLEEGETYDDVATERAGEFFGAHYSSQTKRVTFRREEEPGAWESVLLAHEFVHALQDEAHDLETFLDSFATSTDSALAVRSVVEGEAATLEMRVAPYLLGFEVESDSYEAYVDERLHDAHAALLQDNPIVEAIFRFPYTYGLQSAWKTFESGGMSALEKRYEKLPSSLEIFQARPVDGALVDDFPEIAAPTDYMQVEDDVLGAWIFRAIIAGRTPLEDADELAEAWRGDRFQIFASTQVPELVALAYAIEWSDEAHALQAADLLSLLAPSERLRIVQSPTRTVLYLTSAEGVVDGWLAAP